MELERVGVIRTSDSDLMQFIIGALESDDVYLYHVENKKDSREFTISIYENKHKKIKKIIGGVNINDPDSILGDYLDTKQLDIYKGLSTVPEEIKSAVSEMNFYCKCPTCEKVYKTKADLEADCIEKARTIAGNEMALTYICSKCGGEIYIKSYK